MRLGFVALVVAGCSGNDKPGDTGENTPDQPPVLVEAPPYDLLPIKALFQFTDGEVDGRRIMYYAPEGPPRALLFAFHGGNGGFQTVTQEEWLELYNLLVPFDVAIVLSESLDRQTEEWSIEPGLNNLDWLETVKVRDFLIEETSVEEDTKVISVGFSSGGNFSDVFVANALASGWDVPTYSVHQSGRYTGPGVPAIFFSAENDESAGPPEDVGKSAEECSSWLATECPHIIGTEIPLDERRFARLPQYSIEDSAVLWQELVDLGFIDQNGVRLVDIADPDAVMAAYERQSQGRYPSLPPTQLRVVWATHRFSSQHVVEEANWFLQHIW
jgi:hypothetical protein